VACARSQLVLESTAAGNMIEHLPTMSIGLRLELVDRRGSVEKT
jgi:hypothetical protein